jgi:hypothetical protein
MRKNKDERFEQLGTKIDPAMAEVLNACCDAMGVDVYHLLQWFAYTIVKASSPMHQLDPRIQRLMTMLDRDAGWQNAFNLCNPDKLKVSQVILILEQEGHKGFGAVMVDKPFFDEARQTECVDDILERVTEVTMSGIYRRIRQMGAEMDCNNLSDVLLTMLDAQDLLNVTERNNSELPQMGDRAENGRPVAYGKRTKRKKHFTPDTMPMQRMIFDDDDKALADMEANYTVEDWEGEIHDTRC